MTIVPALLLLAGAASTIAFTPHEGGRYRRSNIQGASASSGAYAGGSSGAGVGAGYGGGGAGANGFVFPGQASFDNIFQQYFQQMEALIQQQQQLAQRFHAASNNVGSNGLEGAGGVPAASAFAGHSAGAPYGAGGGASYGGDALAARFGGADDGSNAGSSGSLFFSGAGGGHGGGGGGNVQGAQASLGVGPQGGYGQASLFPDPNLASRIAGAIDAPSGQGTYGVFSSASSGTSDINGKRTSFKQATVGVNDNGKVQTFSVKDP